MNKRLEKMILLLMLLISTGVYAGQVDLPTEHLVVPELQGDYLVCIWDETANDWQTGFTIYDHKGSFNFQVPEWGKWYWVGLWDQATGTYVFGKWVGHFETDLSKKSLKRLESGSRRNRNPSPAT